MNYPVNLVDPSGLMPFTLQRQQRQNQNLAVLGRQNSYAVQPDTQVGYVGAAVGQDGFNTPYLGRAAQPDGMAAPRAALGQAGQNWQPFSDPEPRQQSQGFRPKACGFTDVLFGFGSSALNGNLLKDSFEFVQHGREIALSLMPMEMWELGFQLAVGFSPFDLLYDLGSLVAGQDLLTGESLSTFDQIAIIAGFLTLGLGDDLIKAGKLADKAVNAAKVGKKWTNPLSRLRQGVAALANVVREKGFKETFKDLGGWFTKKADDFGTGLRQLGQRFKQKVDNFFGGGGGKRPRGDLPQRMPDSEDISRVARAGERAMDEYEAGIRKYVSRIGERAMDEYEAGIVRHMGEQAMNAYEAGIARHMGEQAMNAYEAGIAKHIKRGKVTDFTDMVVKGVPKSRIVRPLPSNKFFDLGRAWKEGWRSNTFIDIALGMGSGFVVEGVRQLQYSNDGVNDAEDARGFGLAIFTGAVLGGSVSLRKKVAGESYGRAFAQVAAGAGFNAAVARLGSDKPGDLYIAALIGGTAIPVTGFFEKRNPANEALVNAGVGAFANSVQYSLSQVYKGKDIEGDELLFNFAGGVGPGGVKAGMNKLRLSPGKYDDFIVTAGASFTGGYLIPFVFSELFGK